jgi:hypothetical protein
LDVEFLLMSEAEDLPRFPDITPDSVKASKVWVFENADFTSQSDVDALLQQLFNSSEDSFYLYCEEHTSINPLINSGAHFGAIRVIESQGFHYPHPKYERHYVRIREPFIQWEWEREVRAKGPMLFRHELKLSERAKRDLEQAQLLQRQRAEREAERVGASPDNPLKLEPNFMGLGIDLRKAWAWFKRRPRKG